MQYTFTFDHGVSDGAGGYGAVVVNLSENLRGVDEWVDTWYIGRGFAAHGVLVERFPNAGLTYDGARKLVTWLAVEPTGKRSLVATNDIDCDGGEVITHWAIGGTCVASESGLWCDCDAGDIGCNYEAASEQASRQGWYR